MPSPLVVKTMIPYPWQRADWSGRYAASAGWPLAPVATRRMVSRRPPAGTVAKKRATSARPAIRVSSGGMDRITSSRSSAASVDVAALPRVGEPVQDLPLVIIEPRVAGRHPLGACRQGGPGALQSAVDRRDANLQQVRHLGGAPGQHVAQDEGGALPGGQPLQRGDERERDALPPSAIVVGSAPVL